MYSTKNSNELDPLFITGHWRSGTTLISRMMNNHPDISVTYDLVHFLRFAYNRYNPINVESSAVHLVKDVSERINQRYQINLSVNNVMENINGRYNYSSIYDAIMTELLLKDDSDKIWGEKTNVAWRSIPDFFDMFPNGRVINIIRDPRAVLSSWKQFTHASGNDYLDSILNSYDAMSTAIFYNSDYSEKRYFTVIYEELVSSPYKTMNDLCNKIDIPFSEEMLDQSQFKDIHGESWKSNSVDKDMPSGIYVNALCKWKENLDEWEISLCEKITGCLFDNFGYVKKTTNQNQDIQNKMVSEIMDSRLASEGMVRFMLTGESVERYPADPTNSINW